MSAVMEVVSVKKSPSGKSVIVGVVGRKDGYFAKTDCGIEAGMKIEAETEASEYNGKTSWWIRKWKRAGTPAPAAAAPIPEKTVQVQEQFTSQGINMAYLPFVSNTVAHAIAAGKVETPADIQKWAQGAYTAALSLKDVPY